jgi:hypothetical protein
VAASDAPRVISAVRELQRTLRLDACVEEAEVLIRCALPSNALPAEPADDPPPEPPASLEATVMETYRLALALTAGPATHATVRTFLAALATAALPLAGMLRGDRHVELFAPCAS